MFGYHLPLTTSLLEKLGNDFEPEQDKGSVGQGVATCLGGAVSQIAAKRDKGATKGCGNKVNWHFYYIILI